MNGVILIADDREDDRIELQRLLRKAAIANPIKMLDDGDEVIDYLGRDLSLSSLQVSAAVVLFLDLKMPRRNGFEVLKWIQAHPPATKLFTFVISDLHSVDSVSQAYQLGADSFFFKPINLPELRSSLLSFPGPWSFGKPSLAAI